MPKNQSKVPPMFFKIGTVKPSFRKKNTPDLQPIFERRLGEFLDPEGKYPIYTQFKLYCKEPDWEHPDFGYFIQMCNGASSQPVYAKLPPDELFELISGVIYWLKENKLQHDQCIDKSRELLKRKKIAEQHATILSDLSLDTEAIENNYSQEALSIKEKKQQKNNILNFLNYFYRYFESNNPIHKRQCLDYMLSLLPNHTDEILNLVSTYREHPEYLEEDKDKIKEQLSYFFDNKDLNPEHLESQQLNINN